DLSLGLLRGTRPEKEMPMRRKTVWLVVMLALVILTAPLIAEAQTPAPIPRIGIIGDWPEDSPAWQAFREGLRDLGYVEGQNIAIAWRFTEGQLDRVAEAAAELVRLK